MKMPFEIFSRAHNWGVCDCCTCPSDVFLERWGVDPMTGIRGTYQTEREALRVILSRGGFEAMAHDQAARVGLRPGVGDVGELGLVTDQVPTDTGGALALCVSPGLWWVKDVAGMVAVGSVTASWAV
jgi:hypothetical protein